MVDELDFPSVADWWDTVAVIVLLLVLVLLAWGGKKLPHKEYKGLTTAELDEIDDRGGIW
jgi:hypothetical protein